jgi:sigma-B regulation protein RsbU (phosphoserine phosphatase)
VKHEELDRDELLRLLERERELRVRAEEALLRHATELSLASDELMRQADALLERDRLAQQMEIARRIQLSVLPPPLVTASYEVHSAMDAADAVGGDFCELHQRRDSLWLAIGDVTGHGIDAGLVMLMAQASFALATEMLGEPHAVLEHVNRVLYENVRLRMRRKDHMTLVAARARADGSVVFAGAHDVDLIVVHANGTSNSYHAEGIWLGLAPKLTNHPSQSFTLNPGDLLVMATDGVVDCPGRDAHRFGFERLVDAAVRERAHRPAEIVAAIRAELATWKADAPTSCSLRFDDVALIVARYLGPS